MNRAAGERLIPEAAAFAAAVVPTEAASWGAAVEVGGEEPPAPASGAGVVHAGKSAEERRMVPRRRGVTGMGASGLEGGRKGVGGERTGERGVSWSARRRGAGERGKRCRATALQRGYASGGI
jgi:hypothetical protein